MQLDIDTTGQNRTVIRLTDDHGRQTVREAVGTSRSETALSLVSDALSQAGRTLADLTAITVNTGPGSFTGTRVGIAVARTLGLLLDIPVNGRPATSDITPRYLPSKFDEDPA